MGVGVLSETNLCVCLGGGGEYTLKYSTYINHICSTLVYSPHHSNLSPYRTPVLGPVRTRHHRESTLRHSTIAGHAQTPPPHPAAGPAQHRDSTRTLLPIRKSIVCHIQRLVSSAHTLLVFVCLNNLSLYVCMFHVSTSARVTVFYAIN